MWLPMGVSAVALAAGLAGVVLTRDWRLLLVVAAMMGLSEGIGFVCFSELFKRGRDIEEWKAKAGEKPGSRVKPAKVIGWIDAVAAGLMTCTAVMFAMYLQSRFSASFADARWVKVCLFLGCACVPWCYRSSCSEERFRKWSVFAVAAFTACWLMALPNEPLLRAGDFSLLLFPAHLIRRWILNRKVVSA